jgi:hypothetical protein
MQHSYNQILFYIEKFAEGHLQVKSWGNGFQPDLNTFIRDNDMAYFLFAQPLSVELTERVANYRMRVYCLDIKQKDNNNSKDVLSDTAQILRDFRKYLIYNFEQHKLWTLEGTSSTLLPVNNFSADYAVGWYLDIIISTNIIEGDCDVPYDPLNFPVPIPPLQFLTCETLPSCPTIISIQEDIEDIWEAIENLDVDVSWGNITGDINEQTDLINLIQSIDTSIENRHEWISPYSYCGVAPNGSLETDEIWTINRIEVLLDGSTDVKVATNVAWTDRFIVIYS